MTYVVMSAPLQAQAPPGPMGGAPSQDPPPPPRPQVQKPTLPTRTSIVGEWVFNRTDSDDPAQKLQDARSRRSSSNGGYGGGGPRMGYPGGGLGGRRMGSQGESDDERQKMQELVNPPSKLTVAEPVVAGAPPLREVPSTEIDLFDDQQRKRALFTDGRKLQKSKDANYQEIAAHWDGKQLVTDEKSPHGGKMSRSYELSYEGTQLYETLHLTTGRNSSPVIIRFVYDATGAAAKPPAAAATPASTVPASGAPKQ